MVQRRTNVLGDVYRKLKRNYEFLLLKSLTSIHFSHAQPSRTHARKIAAVSSLRLDDSRDLLHLALLSKSRYPLPFNSPLPASVRRELKPRDVGDYDDRDENLFPRAVAVEINHLLAMERFVSIETKGAFDESPLDDAWMNARLGFMRRWPSASASVNPMTLVRHSCAFVDATPFKTPFKGPLSLAVRSVYDDVRGN